MRGRLPGRAPVRAKRLSARRRPDRRPGADASLARWLNVTAAVALLYAAGFVVTNRFLGSYEIPDLELFRVRYAAAAVSWALLTWLAAGFALSATLFAVQSLKRAGPARPSWPRRALACSSSFALHGVVLLVVWLVLAFTPVFLQPWPWRLGTGYMALVFVSTPLWLLLWRESSVPRRRLESWGRRGIGSAVLLLTLGVWLGTYATAVYPWLLGGFGGGATRLASVSGDALDLPEQSTAYVSADGDAFWLLVCERPASGRGSAAVPRHVARSAVKTIRLFDVIALPDFERRCVAQRR